MNRKQVNNAHTEAKSLKAVNQMNNNLQTELAYKEVNERENLKRIEELEREILNIKKRQREDIDDETDPGSIMVEERPTLKRTKYTSLDDIKSSVLRIKSIKDSSSREYLDTIQEEFDNVLLPAMKVHQSSSTLVPGLSVQGTIGQAFKNSIILAAMIKLKGIDAMEIERHEMYGDGCKRTISWNKYARDVKGKYNIQTTNYTVYKESLK
jgi:hypothetical protein